MSSSRSRLPLMKSITTAAEAGDFPSNTTEEICRSVYAGITPPIHDDHVTVMFFTPGSKRRTYRLSQEDCKGLLDPILDRYSTLERKTYEIGGDERPQCLDFTFSDFSTDGVQSPAEIPEDRTTVTGEYEVNWLPHMTPSARTSEENEYSLPPLVAVNHDEFPRAVAVLPSDLHALKAGV